MLIGLDIGTSSTKGVLIDDRGEMLASFTSEYRIDQPRVGWTEQDPAVWWNACVEVFRALAGRAGERSKIRAVGLSGQMHGSVFLDRAAVEGAGRGPVRAVRPALLWNDQRTAAQCAAIEEAMGGREALVRAVGNAALTGFTLPKLLWLRDHEPEHFARTALLLNPKDFARLCLTGEPAADVGDGAGTLLLDPTTRTWNDAVFARLNLDRSLVPERVLESAAVAGRVTAWAAAETGLPEGIPVVAGSGDNQCGAVGAGVVTSGMVLATLGTSGVIYAHADEPRRDLGGEEGGAAGRVHTMCAADGRDGAAGRWSITGVMLSAAGALHWARDTIAPGADFAELMREAEGVEPGCEGLVFLPYLTGERCPFPDPTARGAWIGLSSRHTRGHLIRAVLEGVTANMGIILGIVEALPVRVEKVRLGGGGNRSRLWRQMQADVYGKPVATLNAEEGPAFGAALLAGVGAGAWASVPEACAATIRETETIDPGPEAGRYAPVRAGLAELYATLAPAFRRTA